MRKRLSNLLQFDGLEKAAALLSNLPPSQRESLLTLLTEQDPVLTEKISELMCTFEQLLDLDARSIQVLLAEVNYDLLVMSLRSVPESARAPFLANVSHRKREMILDDLSLMEAVPISQVIGSQKEILKLALALAEQGKITFGDQDEWIE
jgi:flagellar motor switch protein FliG